MSALGAVVFDVDGTLVDSERDGHRVAFNRAFEDFGLPYRWDVDGYGRLLSITGGQNRLQAYLDDQGVPEDERNQLVPKLHRRKTEIFNELVAGGGLDPRPGSVELLDELDGAGVHLAVATTGTRGWVLPLLERLFGEGRFEAVITGDEVPVRKPDPSAHLMAVEHLGVDVAEAVTIEDSRNGLEAARAAGLRCAMVVNGYTRDQDMHEADLVLDDFGTGDDPAEVLYDPHGLKPPGRLDLATLRRLAETG